MMSNISTAELQSVESENIVASTLLIHPEFYYGNEDLKIEYFTDVLQRTMYEAISAFPDCRCIGYPTLISLLENLRAKKGTGIDPEKSSDEISRWYEQAMRVAAATPEDYRKAVETVKTFACRRQMVLTLQGLQLKCVKSDISNVMQAVSETIDETMMEFSGVNELELFANKVDNIWNDIITRQQDRERECNLVNFPILQDYVTLERGELVVLAAPQKMGKSMVLQNWAVDLLKSNKKVLYIDSELNSRLFTIRMLSCLTGLTFKEIQNGTYNEEGRKKIENAIKFIKSKTFFHEYMPVLTQDSLYTTVKKAYHKYGIDVFIVDYFKSGGDLEAFENSQKIGNIINCCKNNLAGALNIVGIGAAQMYEDGRLAESKKIERYASTILKLQNKSQDEIREDGAECGNRKLSVVLNRNGPQHDEKEWIDIDFDGDICRVCEAEKQHQERTPF